MARKKPYIIFVTVSSKKEAEKISRSLVELKLAACVNIILKVQSVFRWRGKIDRASELLLIIKTEFHQLAPLEKLVKRFHSYQNPEIIGFPIAWGSKEFLNWISDSLD